VGEAFVALGILLVGTGWIVDRRRTTRNWTHPTYSTSTNSTSAGTVVAIVGGALVCVSFLSESANSILTYLNDQSPFGPTSYLPTWTMWVLDTVTGLGIITIAAGWWMHRRAMSVGSS
jgi:heme/copper-type cytochrome/quinol oxidase subunit 1